MTELNLTLPWPPSVNHYKKVGGIVRTKSGKIYQKRVNTRETTGFYYQVYMKAKMGMPKEWEQHASRSDLSFGIHVYLYPPDNRRRDIDNVLKVLLDSLVHAHVIKDDSQITRLFIQKMDIIPHGEVKIQIFPIGEKPHDPLLHERC